MSRGILYVASRPSSPDRDQEYNDWYTNVHLREVVAPEGFVDLEAILGNLLKVALEGGSNMSDALQMDPPPEVRPLELTADHG